ncbi:pentapeptide repeat-containing protein [Pseudanabaena sp. UWO311]|uniref:pentapeptide repeat-containing protein n=1 Tax=Pseudanabaena sp. UWO311 TaxID=2487337 RepID=UPI0011574EAF|nr:pentapeptide repeat-containing protein [Pseudanabaena sp. UWO311]TYQ28113.1 pentapeptide repeat-containing protein [Pseudanabaena sp. UWO311]
MLKFSVAFASIGGTSFRGADLRNANFTQANLKSSDFRNYRDQNIPKNTDLAHTLWNQSKKLDRARVGQSILSNPEVRELLVTGKPNPSKSYEGLNLRGANLDGVYLENVNFKRAILSEASFRNANLEWVNLTEAQAIGTDFTGAQMTGVCLEGWSYDHTTKLDDVDCRFVFELEHPNTKGSRERRPHDPNKEFEEGDFTKRYSETLNVLQLLIRNGINREAFIAAWEKLTEEYPDLNPDDIQEIKKKGQDVELTVAVPEDTDKGKFEHNFDLGYETKLKEIEAKYQAQLESKDAMFLLQKQSITDIKEILQIAKSSNINVSPTFQNEAKSVAEQNPVTIKAGRDISGNVINLGEIKGNVTNAINQIPNKADSGDIKTLLTQLQEVISADKDLADEDKADALEQVENLAKIALHDKPEEKSTLASKVIRALKRIIDNIPTIAKIVETVSKVFGV